MCQAYLYPGQREEAQSACNEMFRTSLNDIYANKSDRAGSVQMMLVNGLVVTPNLSGPLPENSGAAGSAR